MDGQVEATALGGDVAKEEVLEALVLGFVWVRRVKKCGVNVRSFCLWDVIEAEGA
jgi:predicted cupin superfamily sugar epimerase